MAVAMSKAPAASGKRAQMLIDGSWLDSASGEGNIGRILPAIARSSPAFRAATPRTSTGP